MIDLILLILKLKIPIQQVKHSQMNKMKKSPKYNVKRNAEIVTVIETLLEAINDDHVPNQEDKQKLITQYYHHDEDIVDLEIND